MTTLVIVESPGKTKKLGSILGAGYRVVASVGHVRDLPEAGGDDIGVSPPDFQPKYVPTERGKDVLKKLRAEVEKADDVLLATDPDREGEAIAWHVAEALKLKTRKRITFTAITDEKVRAAVASPRNIDMGLVRAQEARRVLDRAYGYRVSPALSERAAQRLSAGRVQSPTVRLVVDRERAIAAFKPVAHFGAELSFTPDPANPASTWRATWDVKPHLVAGAEYMLDQALAERVAALRQVSVASFDAGEATEAPKAPFTTSALQQIASRTLKIKPKKVMELAQKLYEAGHITYHRTDTPNLDAAGAADIAAYAQAAGLPLAAKPRTWKAKEGAQEGHEAIRPTHAADLVAGETAEEQALYRLIWQRAVASQLADARYAIHAATLTGQIDAAGDAPATAVTFKARGRTLVDPGWQRVYAPDDDQEAQEGAQDEPDEASNPVPALTVGAGLAAAGGRLLSKTTKPPARFKQTTLIAELEKLGIGRPSTYVAILENVITSRGYLVEDAKGFLRPSPVGEAVRDALVGTFGFAELDYTRELEDQLDAIAEGKAPYLRVVGAAWDQLSGELATLASIAPPAPEHPCPNCGKAMRQRQGDRGPWWGCTGYPACKTTAPDDNGKPGERKPAAAPEASGYTCQVEACGGAPLVRRTGTSKPTGKGKSAKPGKAYDFFSCTKCRKIYNVKDNAPVFDA